MDLPFNHLVYPYMYPDCALLFCISSRKRKKCPEFLPTVIPFLKNKIKYTRWRHREYPAHDLYHPTSHFLYCWSNENASLPLTEFLYSLHACLFRKCMHFSLDFHSSEANYYLWLMFVPTTLLFNWTFGLCLDSNASTFQVLYSKDQCTYSARLNRTVISNDTELTV